VLALLLAASPLCQSAMPVFLGEAHAAGGEGPAVEPTPADRSRHQRTVFVCQQDGVPVFTTDPAVPPPARAR
jgi:hypothetical protein